MLKRRKKVEKESEREREVEGRREVRRRFHVKIRPHDTAVLKTHPLYSHVAAWQAPQHGKVLV